MPRHLPIIHKQAHEGLTNRDLCQLAGIREDRLSRIRHGHAQPTRDEAERLAAALNIDVELIVNQEPVTAA